MYAKKHNNRTIGFRIKKNILKNTNESDEHNLISYGNRTGQPNIIRNNVNTMETESRKRLKVPPKG